MKTQVLAFTSILLSIHARAVILDLTPGAGFLPIEQVTYDIAGSDVVQNVPASGVASNGDTPVRVKSVRITDGAPIELGFFNTTNAVVVNVNPQFASISGVGVFDNGVTTRSDADLTAYANAFAATVLDTDLRHFAFHDYLKPAPPTPGVPDLDVWFYHAIEVKDYFLVAERWGNSQFTITALQEDGTPYAGANVLRLGGPGGDPGVGYQVYDWNTGYAAATNVPSQAQALSLFSAGKFFEGTQVTPGPIYGLRIDNDGEADPKIMGIGADTFLNNPVHSQVVPEPSTLLMAFGSSVLLLCRRRARPE